jgi:hypothetical protein
MSTPEMLPVRLQEGGSPNGELKFTVHAGKLLDIERANGEDVGQFLFHPDDVHFGNTDALSWLDSRYILFLDRYPAVIDATTMKMSYLPDELATVDRSAFGDEFHWVAFVKKDGIHVGRIIQPSRPASEP